MTEKSPAAERKAKRLAAALRENLKRRKTQTRGRAQMVGSAPEAAGGPTQAPEGTGLSPQSRGDLDKVPSG
jgi:hypothetical protein